MRIGVMVSGGGTNLQAIMDSIDSGHLKDVEIATVVSNRKQAYALERAALRGIDAAWISPRSFADREAFNQALIEHMASRQVDLVVLAGYLVILGESFIQAFEGRIINVHPSLIPSFCGGGFHGLKVHEGVLARGVKVTGATVHFVDEGTDTGPIICQKAVAVMEDDTPETLQKRVMEEAEWVLLPQAIDWIAKGLVKIEGSRARVSAEKGLLE